MEVQEVDICISQAVIGWKQLLSPMGPRTIARQLGPGGCSPMHHDIYNILK